MTTVFPAIQELYASGLPFSLGLGQKAGFVFVALISFKLWRRRSPRYPPGPTGLPLVGNLFQLGEHPWQAFAKWIKEYGPVVYFKIAGQGVLVLGSQKAAFDLLDRRAAIYSGRPRNIVSGEIMSGGMVYLFHQPQDTWRRMRRSSHIGLSNSVSKEYYSIQEREMVILIDQILNTPQDYIKHIYRASASLLLSITYGFAPFTDPEDSTIKRTTEYALHIAQAAVQGTFLVEYFTWMKYLPRWMCGWRQYAEAWFSSGSATYLDLYAVAKDRIQSGDATKSVVQMALEDASTSSLSDDEVAWANGTIYGAGAETSAGQILWFILAMVLHPAVQKRAQEEIDRVVGRDRLPAFQDSENLPYIQAVVQEVLRWRPIGPAGVPHYLEQDDWYEGYFIPKGTICIGSIWAINRDTSVYGPDVDVFRPERYLGNGVLADGKEAPHVTYGFGRRICIGRHVANNTLFIEVARLLWAFDMRPPQDETGHPILPNPDVFEEGGLAVPPAHFPCSITPRGDIRAVLDEAKESYGFQNI